METFIYVLRLTERLYDDSAWTASDEAIVTEHFNRLKDDRDRGIVQLAGRTEKTDDTGFGIVIFRAGDRETAAAYMLDDPAVSAGIMTAELHGFRTAVYE